MLNPLPSTPLLDAIYNALKSLLWFAGGVWLVYKGFSWITELKNNDLASLHKGVASLEQELKEQTKTIREESKEQTAAIVTSLGELRSDFRLLVGSFIAPPRPARARAKKR